VGASTELFYIHQVVIQGSEWSSDIYDLPGKLAAVIFYGGAYGGIHFYDVQTLIFFS
jgi:hypothetical protein